MNAKLLTPLCAIMLLCVAEAAAQPTCFYSYPVSLDCPDTSGDTVFLGRVVSLTETNPQTGGQVESDRLTGHAPGKAVVEVEELFKGRAGAVVDLPIRGRCYGQIEKGGTYIFNLNLSRAPVEHHTQRWSYALDYLTEGDAAKLLNTIRAVIKGERQPRLFGTLRDVGRLTPIAGVAVVAEKGGVKFEAYTDAEGRYEFRELPEGDYQVYPVLWPALRPAEYSGLRHARPGDTTRIIKDVVCGTRLDFMAVYNGVISGRVEGAYGKPFARARATLWSFGEGSKWASPYKESVRQKDEGDFSFVDLPPGRYRIEVTVPGDSTGTPVFYYPGLASQKDARVIKLAAGQALTGLIIKLPIPRKK